MGIFSVPIRIGNRPGQAHQQFDAIVDTGATLTSLPGSVLDAIGIARTDKAPFHLANGETGEADTGEAIVSVYGSETPTQVLFAEENSYVLLGITTLEDLSLGVDPP